MSAQTEGGKEEGVQPSLLLWQPRSTVTEVCSELIARCLYFSGLEKHHSNELDFAEGA